MANGCYAIIANRTRRAVGGKKALTIDQSTLLLLPGHAPGFFLSFFRKYGTILYFFKSRGNNKVKKYNVKVGAVDSLSRKHKKKNKQNSNKKIRQFGKTNSKKGL
tara:strand:+ start:212 stop:526 length:315 start_codon:yes stop_codon:yes gene_type:complete